MKPVVRWCNLFRSWFFPSLGGLLYGFDIGAMSMVLVDLRSAEFSGSSWSGTVNASASLAGVIVAMTTWGAMVGSIMVFYAEARLGRRREMLSAGVFYAVGAGLQASTPNFSSATACIVWFCLGRFVYGIGVGFAMHGAPSYIGETAPAQLRGALVSAKEAMIVLGMLLGYIVGALFQTTEGGWRYVFWLVLPLAFVFGAGVYFLPPSPRWLSLRRAPASAIQASIAFVTENVENFKEEDSLNEKEQSPSLIAACRSLTQSSASRAALKVGLGLVFFQQVTGQPSVLYYADDLFESLGLGATAVVAVALWKLLATVCAVAFADSYGRKRLLYVGCFSMGLALAVLAIYTSTSHSVYTVLGAMFVYIGGYQVGFGPVVWLYVSEIFPLKIRGQALSIAVFFNFALNALITLACAPLLAWSPSFTFFIFFLLIGLSLVFIKTQVPETKGLSLEAITNLLVERANKSNLDNNDEEQKLLSEESSLLASRATATAAGGTAVSNNNNNIKSDFLSV